MTFKRWLPTFLAFPIGGWIAIETIGSSADPLSAAAGGLVAGGVIGAAQWLALRAGRRWIAATAAATAAGAALSAVLTGSGTDLADVMLAGLVTGAAVGAAQASLLGRGARAAVAWTTVTAAAWSLGWLVTWNVIVDADRGHHMFGSSGAVVATLITGVALRALARAARPAARPAV
jgi:hypothetical protein